jgi:hypothetical protein
MVPRQPEALVAIVMNLKKPMLDNTTDWIDNFILGKIQTDARDWLLVDPLKPVAAVTLVKPVAAVTLERETPA